MNDRTGSERITYRTVFIIANKSSVNWIEFNTEPTQRHTAQPIAREEQKNCNSKAKQSKAKLKEYIEQGKANLYYVMRVCVILICHDPHEKEKPRHLSTNLCETAIFSCIIQHFAFSFFLLLSSSSTYFFSAIVGGRLQLWCCWLGFSAMVMVM